MKWALVIIGLTMDNQFAYSIQFETEELCKQAIEQIKLDSEDYPVALFGPQMVCVRTAEEE